MPERSEPPGNILYTDAIKPLIGEVFLLEKLAFLSKCWKSFNSKSNLHLFVKRTILIFQKISYICFFKWNFSFMVAPKIQSVALLSL